MNDLFDKLKAIIKGYDNVIVMGHKDPDLDCLGASLGLCEIIEFLNVKSYLFLNDKHLENYNTNINQAFNKMEKDIICVNNRTYKKINGKILLIIVDVHSSERLEYSKLIDEFDTVVLDHHIKNSNYIKNTKLFYIDSNLSSMSELITYFAKSLSLNIDNVIATILLAGIEIDTNGYNLKTTSKTYEAASILLSLGADTILKQELLKETKDDYLKRASIIKNSFMINENIAMCIIYSLTKPIELAEVAEELLTLEDVKASFIIGKIENNIIGVSARSLGDIDVSLIMKNMGGGGHSSNAATQIKDKTLKEVKQEIINLIKNIEEM